MKTLLIIPPFIQVNTYYPSVTQLTGFLKNRGYEARSFDLSLAVLLKIFCREGLNNIFAEARKSKHHDISSARILQLAEKYVDTIDTVISFLQGKNNSMAYRLVGENYLPQGDSFQQINLEQEAFGFLGIQDKARYYCSLYIDDICRFIAQTITPHFGLSRYAEKTAISCPDFNLIETELLRPENYIEKIIEEETIKQIKEYSPNIVGYTIPFPGNLLAALISARVIKKSFPEIKIVLGGGYVNTELRSMSDTGIFSYIDFITYDDGELPLLKIISNLSQEQQFPSNHSNSQYDKNAKVSEELLWVRTLTCTNGQLNYLDNAPEKQVNPDGDYTPDLEGIEPDKYFSMTEMLNPMHRLWTDGFWHKLTVAHGCYWRKCTFCDITLDYIARYSPSRASTIVDRMETLIKATGRSSFHFTDEAAPPALLKDIAIEILKRKLQVVWWGNIRFEKTYTPDLCRLLALSGCTAVSGGLEAAEERLLRLINKGVTIPQVAQVLKNFNEAGIMVHAYLMYGFPTQSEQEIVDSLEIVRQLFAEKILKSAFWHRFSLTIHSPIASKPENFNIEISDNDSFEVNPFANNDIDYVDNSGIDYTKYSDGLNKALYNYMHGIGIAWDVNEWFEQKLPATRIKKGFIRKCISNNFLKNDLKRRAIWIGSEAVLSPVSSQRYLIEAHTVSISAEWETDHRTAEWIKTISIAASLKKEMACTVQEIIESYTGDFYSFTNNEIWQEIKENFLLFI